MQLGHGTTAILTLVATSLSIIVLCSCSSIERQCDAEGDFRRDQYEACLERKRREVGNNMSHSYQSKTTVGGGYLSYASTGYYNVEVTRKGQDLYEITGTATVIKTRLCYEHVYFDASILHVSDPYAYNIGKLAFGNGATCDVQKILK